MKKILIIIFLLTLTNCGFSPLYNAYDEVDYDINLVEIKGDNIINNKIISEISRLTNKNSKKVFKIKLITNYSKTIISKDAKGSATNYELSIDAKFYIQLEGEAKEITINEKQNIKKISDIFEQRNYENTVKNNIAISIVNRLNIELLSIK